MKDTRDLVDCEHSPDGTHWWGADEYDNRCQWCDRKPWYETATVEGRRRKAEREALRHTVRGQTSDEGWPYGQTHDMDCPACVASGASFLASPRSETYWSS